MKPVGVAFAEINLDSTPMERNLKKMNDALTEGTVKVENAYKSLGIKSDQVFNMMKANAVAAVEFIQNKTLSSLEEIYNAEKAMAAKIAAINEKQFAMQRDQYSARVTASKAASDAIAADRQALGVRTTEIINAEKVAIESAYLRQKVLAADNSRDLIELENAKNAKMLALNTELYSARIATMQQEKAATMSKVEAEIAAEKTRIAEVQKNEQALRTMGLAQISAQKEDAARTKTINDQKTQAELANYNVLGMTSAASINERIADVQRAATAQQLIVGKSSDDWQRIERAKNEKLKELNREMTGDHEMSMASMTRAVLRFYAAYYVISAVVGFMKEQFMAGINAIDDMKIASISVAAQITSMQGTTGNVAENYKTNLKYAEALIPVLQQVDANSLANLSQIQKMNMAMTNQGVILDVNKAKQIEAFTALTNAVAMYTTGQDQEKQASQEIRSLMSGQIRAGDMVAMQMDALIKKQGDYKGGLKELVAEGKKHGDTLERMLPYLAGIVAACGDLNSTWKAVSSSMETAWNIIQRALFRDIYKEFTTSGKDAAAWMKKNADDIVASIKTIYETTTFAIKSTIAFFILFGATAWIQAANAADAAAWFALRWEIMTTAVTLSTSKMLLGFSIFTAAITGFSIGKYLSNEFEWARFAGISMVYGVMDTWEFFVSKLKIGWEYLKIAAAATSDMSQEESDAMANRAQIRINAIEKGYKDEKSKRDQWRDQQFKDESNAGKALAKMAADAAKNKIITPIVPPTKDQTKDSVKDRQNILSAMKQADKAYYDEQQKNADQVYQLAQKRGENEFELITDLYSVKRWNLENYLQTEIYAANEEVNIAAKQATMSKDGVAKKYDAEAVLAEKMKAIWAKYNKDKSKLDGEELIAIEKANLKRIDIMAAAEKMINQYSNESLITDIDKINKKWMLEKAYAKDNEDRARIELARIKEIENAYDNQTKSIADAIITLYSITNPYVQKSHDAQMSNWIIEVKALKEKGATEAETEDYLYAKETDYQEKKATQLASYYSSVQGMGQRAYKFEINAIAQKAEKWRLAGIDQIAINKMVEQSTRDAFIKMADNSEGWINGIKAGFKLIDKEYVTWSKGLSKVTFSMYTNMSKGFSDIFYDSITGKLTSLSDYFTSFANSVLRSFTDMLGQMAAKKILMFFGASFTSEGIQTLGIIDKLLGTDLAKSAIGAATDIASEISDNILGAAAWTMAELGFAKGGRPPVGKPVWVGEEGKELLFLDSPGYVMDHNKSMDYAARNGGYIPGYADGGIVLPAVRLALAAARPDWWVSHKNTSWQSYDKHGLGYNMNDAGESMNEQGPYAPKVVYGWSDKMMLDYYNSPAYQVFNKGMGVVNRLTETTARLIQGEDVTGQGEGKFADYDAASFLSGGFGGFAGFMADYINNPITVASLALAVTGIGSWVSGLMASMEASAALAGDIGLDVLGGGTAGLEAGASSSSLWESIMGSISNITAEDIGKKLGFEVLKKGISSLVGGGGGGGTPLSNLSGNVSLSYAGVNDEGIGDILSKYMSSIPKHTAISAKNGLSNFTVPYDGFNIVTHKDETVNVTPKGRNNNSGSGLSIGNLQLIIGGKEFKGEMEIIADGVYVKRDARGYKSDRRLYQ